MRKFPRIAEKKNYLPQLCDSVFTQSVAVAIIAKNAGEPRITRIVKRKSLCGNCIGKSLSLVSIFDIKVCPIIGNTTETIQLNIKGNERKNIKFIL